MNRQDHELAAHDPWLRRLARRLARSRTRADDLVQDTYVTALRNAPPDVQLRPWLRSVMQKLAWGQVRSDQRRIQREEGFSLTAPMLTLPDVLPDHGVDRERLTDALEHLPEPFQSTIVQRFLQGRSCAEIARRDNIPAGTVRWRQARGLELLRAQLEPPRRRFAIWALPFLGAGQQLVARLWQGVVARLGGSKALWLLVACAAMIYAIVGAKSPHGAAAAEGDDRRDGIALADVSPEAAASLARAGARRGAPRRAAGSGDPSTLDAALDPVAAEPDALANRDFARAALDSALAIDRDDCTWDPVHGRRCPGAAMLATADPQCALIRQRLAIGDTITMSSRANRAVLAQTMQAQRALAQRLGCGADVGEPRPAPGDGSKPATGKQASESKPPTDKPASDPETPPIDSSRGFTPPATYCVIQYNTEGVPCSACDGLPLMCPDAECHLRTVATGVVCTECTDRSDGSMWDDCPAAQVAGCVSSIANGMLCSSCDGGPTECLPAECTVVDRGCLRCTDPKDRVKTDCSAYVEELGWAASGGGGQSGEGLCVTSSANPSRTAETCHYPGTQSCLVKDDPYWQCLECAYRDGLSTRDCMEPTDPAPDPFSGRPADLPAPGHCVTELAPDHSVQCMTCTRADLSATRSCR